MPLSSAQQAIMRNILGDESETYGLGTENLNTLYDSEDFGNGDFATTVVWALRQLLGTAATSVDKTTPQTEYTVRSSQKFDHYKKLLEYWEGMAGIVSGVVVSMSTTVTNPTRSDLDPTVDPDWSGWWYGF